MLFNEPKLLKCCGTPRRRRRETVSVLFNEPKLLKSKRRRRACGRIVSFSALQRAEIAEIPRALRTRCDLHEVSVLFNEPKLLKFDDEIGVLVTYDVSVLFNEPKLLKSCCRSCIYRSSLRFSALQRAEIAEIRQPGFRQRVAREFQCSSTSRNC